MNAFRRELTAIAVDVRNDLAAGLEHAPKLGQQPANRRFGAEQRKHADDHDKVERLGFVRQRGRVFRTM